MLIFHHLQAAAFRLVAHFGYDDLTFTHLSARCCDGVSFFIQPFGKLFAEVTASALLKVNFEGKILEGACPYHSTDLRTSLNPILAP